MHYYADIAFPSAPTAFTYAVPPSAPPSRERERVVQPGDLVVAPLRTKETHGVVLAAHDDEPSYPTKEILEVVRPAVLPEWQVPLLAWMVDTYKAHAGKTLRLFAPERVIGNKPLKRKTKEAEITPSERSEVELNEAQEKALAEITSPLAPLTKGGIPAQRDGGMFLLHGVTGSGKTEVYLQAILKTIAAGKQATLLVPEIALTPQLVGYFAAVIPPEKITVIHSHLADGQRLATWERIRAGEIDLVIGSRSALFAPLPQPGMLVLDEEHEWTYKNDQSPRYHARGVAQKVAALTNATVVLGSATPSLESYAAAKAGKIHLLELPERANKKALPTVQVVDLRQELKKENYSPISELLAEKIRDRLTKNEQVVLLLNKRGLASSLVCRDCGHVVECPSCTAPMTLHRKHRHPEESAYFGTSHSAGFLSMTGGRLEGGEQLVCHVCGHMSAPPTACPSCGSLRIKQLGTGTQKLETDLATYFPGVRVLRADRDTTAAVGSHQQIFDDFKAGKADILLGTQMVAKGLDLPNVTLVGVLLADVGLHLPDFRAGEKTFSLLTQVAGRAGRAEKPGEVVIQTYAPEHLAVQAAARQDYHGFFAQEIADRRTLGYPPFSRLVKFAFVDANEKKARDAAQQFAAVIKSNTPLPSGGVGGGSTSPLSVSPREEEKPVVSVAPALIARQHGKYHWHVVWRGRDVAALFADLEIPDGCRVDVDPVQVV